MCQTLGAALVLHAGLMPGVVLLAASVQKLGWLLLPPAFAVSTWMAESVMLWQAEACSHVCPHAVRVTWQLEVLGAPVLAAYMAQLVRVRRHGFMLPPLEDPLDS